MTASSHREITQSGPGRDALSGERRFGGGKRRCGRTLLRRQPCFAAGLLEGGERVHHFLPRRVTLPVGERALELLDGLLQRPLLRDREGRLRDEILPGEPRVWV